MGSLYSDIGVPLLERFWRGQFEKYQLDTRTFKSLDLRCCDYSRKNAVACCVVKLMLKRYKSFLKTSSWRLGCEFSEFPASNSESTKLLFMEKEKLVELRNRALENDP